MLTSGLEYWRAAVDFQLPDDITGKLAVWKNSVLEHKFPDFKSIYFALLLILGYQEFSLDNDYHLAFFAQLFQGPFCVTQKIIGGPFPFF